MLYVFIALNVVRLISVVSLILVFASNIDTLVHDILAVNKYLTGGNGSDSATSTTISQVDVSYDYIMDSTIPIQPGGSFWAVLNRLLIMGQTIVLLLYEFGWPSVFFERFFPILGKEFWPRHSRPDGMSVRLSFFRFLDLESSNSTY
ncbi:hypothetical protein M378DRAFT_12025 [Amanita muscaria Koide BX008]|uniref:Uncharacterized protein n=1 Tax=Amanita muscaria (strain Koide BX008) TaxID=946122 RepID=A0A0C2WPL5_AMAMK|nr:hypothetical protein M378DRAFT_12025 [Amanita muscaria Koide BX008]